MMRFLYTIICLFFTLSTIAQENDKNSFEETYLPKVNKASCELFYIINKDIYQYYHLDSINTPLKREYFKQTPLYDSLSNIMKAKNKTLFSSSFYCRVYAVLGNYDLKNNGFKIQLDEDAIISGSTIRAPKCIVFCNENKTGVIIESVPTTRKVVDSYGLQIMKESIFIRTNKDIGLQLENNRKDISFYCIFTPKSIKKYTFSILGSSFNHNNILTDTVKFIAINNKSGEIYFDKIFIPNK